MASLALGARTRTTTGRHVHALRRQGQIPAVLYGHNVEPLSITTEIKALQKVWRQAGRSHLVDLKVDGGTARKVIIRDLQIDPRSALPLHADFFALNLREKTVVDVPVVVTGESPAVLRREGQIQQTLTTIRLECLPTDIPAQLTVDVSGLDELDAAIHIRDLELPEGVTLDQHVDAEELVVKVAAVRVAAEEEEAPAAAEGEGEAGEAAAEGGEASGDGEGGSSGE